MVSIDKVYKTVLTLANSDVRGNLKPTELKLVINNVVEEIYEDYFFDITRIRNRQNKGLTGVGLENPAKQTLEKIDYFSKTSRMNTTVLPDDCRYIDTIVDSKGNEFEAQNSSREFNVMVSNASITYPIYLKQGESIKYAPNFLSSLPFTITYLRKPVMANWAFVVINGTEIANPTASDYRNIDLHSSEESKVILKTLMKFGINLQEKDLQVVAQSQENQKFNEEITS